MGSPETMFVVWIEDYGDRFFTGKVFEDEGVAKEYQSEMYKSSNPFVGSIDLEELEFVPIGNNGFGKQPAFKHQLDKGWMIALLTSGIEVELLKKAMKNLGYDDIDEPLKIIQEFLAKGEEEI